jgi:hypothetical protein
MDAETAPEATWTPSSDLNMLFRSDGTIVDIEGRTLTARVVHVGDLMVSTGRIVACDPLAEQGAPFTTAVPSGRHPVFLSSVSFPDGDRRVAGAMLHFGETAPATWRLALRPGQNPRSFLAFPGYGVETGTGCFTDESFYAAPPAENSTAAHESGSDKVGELLAQLEDPDHPWATLDAPSGTSNLIAFSSGWGDGAYASFFGYDSAGVMVCLVTDFAVLPAAEA